MDKLFHVRSCVYFLHPNTADALFSINVGHSICLLRDYTHVQIITAILNKYKTKYVL